MEESARRPLGRPSRIHETFQEGRCAACSDWIRRPIFRAHVEREHPTVPLAQLEAGFEVREVRLVDRIVELIAAGNYLEDACGAVGIRSSVVKRWAQLGREWEEETFDLEPSEVPADRRVYRDFSAALAYARGENVTRRIRRIERAGETDWKAEAWILERTHPDRFGRQDRIRVGGDPDAGPVRLVYEEEDPAFVADVVRIYQDAGILPGVGSPPTNGTTQEEETVKTE